MIEFNQEAWFKTYIDMNKRLKTNSKNNFEEDYFKLIKTSVFGKTMENVRQARDIELVDEK